MNFHDTRETRDPEARERELLARLPAQIAHARAAAPAFGRLLADVDPDSVTSRAALATLPVTRKSELLELQKAARPFGGFSAVALQSPIEDCHAKVLITADAVLRGG